jgi:hypothetical protein
MGRTGRAPLSHDGQRSPRSSRRTCMPHHALPQVGRVQRYAANPRHRTPRVVVWAHCSLWPSEIGIRRPPWTQKAHASGALTHPNKPNEDVLRRRALRASEYQLLLTNRLPKITVPNGPKSSHVTWHRRPGSAGYRAAHPFHCARRSRS